MAEKSEKKSSVSDAGAWALNVCSSVGIIMANKQVMSPSGYEFQFGEQSTYHCGRWQHYAILVSNLIWWRLVQPLL